MSIFCPQISEHKLPKKSTKEKRQFACVAVIYMAMIFLYPVFLLFSLKHGYFIESFAFLFISGFILIFSFIVVDTLIIDWVFMCKWVPRFIKLEGSEKEDYSDFKPHLKGAVMALIMSLILSIIFIERN